MAQELPELNKQNFEPETIQNAKQKIDESKLLKILGLPTNTNKDQKPNAIIKPKTFKLMREKDIAWFFVVCTIICSNVFKASFAVMANSLRFGQVELFHYPPQLWHVPKGGWASSKCT